MEFFLSALLIFGFGIFLGAVTTGFTYLSQSFFAHKKDSLGFKFQIMCIILGLSSLCTFGLGLWFSYKGFGSAFGI
jgi:Na+-driven multidrug efflux pump